MPDKPLSYYLDQYAQGKATPAEKDILVQLVNDPACEQELYEVMKDHWTLWEQSPIVLPETIERVERAIAAQITSEEGKINTPVHRVHFLRRGFFRYAAAVIILAGAAIVTIVVSNRQPHNSKKDVISASSDIPPGGQRAILTLADGRTIALDSMADGQLANEDGVHIVKLANGQVTYDALGLNTKEVRWNTMTTPKGGQYQVSLPDGTKVWLNAASSITYPTIFNGKERRVTITGEAYLEVASNKQQPFFVQTNHGEIAVLGTKFDVSSYDDEDASKVTLLQGSVRFSSIDAGNPSPKNNPKSVVLSAGQQAVLGYNNNRLDIIPDADIEKTMAWKNGLFDFQNMGLHEVMRELARWYDLDIQYEKGVTEVRFGGGMSRNVPLSDVLKGLENMDIHFKIISGRKLLVMP